MKHIPVMFVLIIRPDTLRPVFLRNLGIEPLTAINAL
jgi:hypothetical protein